MARPNKMVYQMLGLPLHQWNEIRRMKYEENVTCMTPVIFAMGSAEWHWIWCSVAVQSAFVFVVLRWAGF